LGIARTFNQYLGLDCEDILFGLLKKGMEPTIAAFFRMTGGVMRTKLIQAKREKIIPDSVDVDFSIGMLKAKITALVADRYGYLFDDVSDTQIVAVKNNSTVLTRIAGLLIQYAFENKDIDAAFYHSLFDGAGAITLISEEKLQRLFAYRNLCHGNNLFLNKFVSSGNLQPLDALLRLSKTEIIAKIDGSVIDSPYLPDEVKSIQDEDDKIESFAKYIFSNIQKQYATRSFLLRLARVPNEAITVFDVENNPNNLFDLFKTVLVDDEVDGNSNNTHLLDTTITENGNTRTFDLAKDSIRDYMFKLGTTQPLFYPIGIDNDAFIRIFAAVQRLYNLTRDEALEEVVYLLKNGFCSAYDIVKFGKYKFLDKSRRLRDVSGYYPKISHRSTDYIFKAAEEKVGRAMALLNKYSQATNSLLPGVVSNKTPLGEDQKIEVLRMPELENLFGCQDVTDTPHSESAISPAAYLVDLLNLFKQIEFDYIENNITLTSTLYEQLIARRPDIEKIPLDSANALTLVPYLDLAIEILEDACVKVVNMKGIGTPGYVPLNENREWGTLSNAEDLKADPDHTDLNAYEALKTQFTWKQPPFDMGLEQLRIYTQALKFDRAKGLKLTGSNFYPYEVLGFTSIDSSFFNGTLIAEIVNSVDYFEENSQHRIYLKNRKVEETEKKGLLNATGFTFVEFQRFLESYFVNPWITPENEPKQRYTIHFEEKIELQNAYLEFATEEKAKSFVYLMYQYNRLLTATQWSIPVLDAVLLNVYKELNPLKDYSAELGFILSLPYIERIAAIKNIQQTLNLSGSQVLSIFGLVNVYPYEMSNSYFRWLLVESNNNEFGQTMEILLNSDNPAAIENTPIFDSEGKMHPFMESFCAVFNLNKETLKEFCLAFHDSIHVIETQFLRNLVRAVFATEALGINATQFKILRKLGVFGNVAQYIQSPDLVQGLTFAKQLLSNGVDLAALMQIVYSVSPTPEIILSFGENKLLQIAQNIFMAIQDFTEAVEMEEFENKVYGILSQATGVTPAIANKIANEKVVNFVRETIRLSKKSTISIKQQKQIADFFAGKPATETALDEQLKAVVIEDLERLTKTIDGDNVYQTLSSTVLDSIFVAYFPATGNNSDFAAELNNLVTDESIRSVVLEYFSAFPKVIIDKTTLANHEKSKYEKELKQITGLKNTYVYINAHFKQIPTNLASLLNKSTQLSGTLNGGSLFMDELRKICFALETAKIFTLSADMVQNYIEPTSASPIDLFNPETVTLDNVKNILLLKEASPYLIMSHNIFTLWKEVTTNGYSACPLFLWSKSDQFSAGHVFSNEDVVVTATSTYKLEWFTELGKMHQLGMSPDEVITMLPVSNITQGQITIAKNAARRILGTSTYRKRVAELRNPLRLRQRDALVLYLIDNHDLVDSTDLFSHFLIDTQMSFETCTSRIVQATLAIQLLMQRIQFNLEPKITLSLSEQNQWRWMSLYRVWEANRKIFLYPENWLEPELRDDKSPFFKELEKELGSNEVSTETAEKAYHDYLIKMEKVANVDYCQMFNHTTDSYSVLHVVGRTRSVPRTYYYRKLVNESFWTAWEPLGLEINTEHIAPVVINDRLMVFWLEYSDDAKEPAGDDGKITPTAESFSPQKPKSQMSVQICWSENRKGEWSPKKLWKHKLAFDPKEVGNKFRKESLRFVYSAEEQVFYLMFDYEKEITIPAQKIVVTHKNIVEPTKKITKTASGGSGSVSVSVATAQPAPEKIIVDDSSGVSTETVKISGQSEFIIAVTVGSEVELTALVDQSEATNIKLPDGTKNYYQKAIDENGIFILPLANSTSSTVDKEILTAAENAATLLYPHHYTVFNGQSPFVVEQGTKSVVCIPVVQPVVVNIEATNINNAAAGIESDIHGAVYHQVSLSEDMEFTDADSDLVLTTGNNGTSSLYQSNSASASVPVPQPKLPKSHIAAYPGYHPFVAQIRRSLEKFGLKGILDPAACVTYNMDILNGCLLPGQANSNKLELFKINHNVAINISKEDGDNDYALLPERFDFDTKSAYGIYNWELFFHIPFMICNRFYTEGNYDEALKWISYIFDPRVSPLKGEAADANFARFWKFRPFAEHNATTGIEDILFDTNMNPGASVETNELNNQLEIWKNDPFKPHNVARMRISAYMKATVMRYLDILIARGDKSFRVDTMESINEALQYYIVAAQILGKQPDVLMTHILEPKTYAGLNGGTMGNAIEFMEEPLIKPENAAFMEHFIESNEQSVANNSTSEDRKMLNMLYDLFAKMQKTEKVFKLYFGIPKNDKMFGYWELVADRLFKIRHSMNLDGVTRTLALFAPPIDPGMLAAATAAGIDIKALVNGQAGLDTHYRFTHTLNRALQLCSDLKSLGAQLLAACEKHDSEMVSALRAQHEVLLSEQITRLREKAIEESELQLQILDKQKELIDFRENFYRSRKKRNNQEKLQISTLIASSALQIGAQVSQILASGVELVPNVQAGIAGAMGSPFFTLHHGGSKIAAPFHTAASVMNIGASILNTASSVAGLEASFARREEEWQFQANMAERELAPLEIQKLSAQLRKTMAQYELENHKKQLAQSTEMVNVLTTKYTNKELYAWMRKEISELQRRAYDMTFKLAKQAERAFDFELNPDGSSKYITVTHFDTGFKGLLAGEKLYLELKELEMAYHEKNKRKFELTKHISLAMLDPQQIIALRDDGNCQILIPEILFDMDHPGHCNRRIKSVSITIPCVAGPYTSVSAELTLGQNSFKSKAGGSIPGQPVISSMATSSAVNDSGMFQLNFNDERYLPFEGAGVGSTWSLSLPGSVRQFDYNTINDVIITIQYTAEAGGSSDENHLSEIFSRTFGLLVDVKSHYPEVFEQLKTGSSNIELSKDMLPWFLRNKTIAVNSVMQYSDGISSVIEDATWPNIPLPAFGGTVPERLVLMVTVSVS
jgi:hypothetical protein